MKKKTISLNKSMKKSLYIKIKIKFEKRGKFSN